MKRVNITKFKLALPLNIENNVILLLQEINLGMHLSKRDPLAKTSTVGFPTVPHNQSLRKF